MVVADSGPAYQPINQFLREISSLTSSFRQRVATHPGLTFTATVRHICSGIRKLAAVAEPEEALQSLYRGVRGELPRNFWVPDDQEMVIAVHLRSIATQVSPLFTPLA